MNPLIPIALLILGLAEMVLKDLGKLPTPRTVSTVIAVICLILAIVSLYLTFRLQGYRLSLKETGRRGHP